MNQFHLYPHQIYRRNTRNNLYTDESRGESPVLEASNRVQPNPKEINISQYEEQKQRRTATEASPKQIDQKQSLNNKSPSQRSSQSKRTKTTGDELRKSQNSNFYLPSEKSARTSSRKNTVNDRQQSKKFIEDDDGDVFDRKPKSTNLIGIDNSRGFVDAQEIIDKSQNERVPIRNQKSRQQSQEINLFINNEEDYRPNSRSQQKSMSKRSNRADSKNQNRSKGENRQDQSQEQVDMNNPKLKVKKQQSSKDQNQQNGTVNDHKQMIEINFQDIKFEKEQNNSNGNSDEKNKERAQSRQNKGREDDISKKENLNQNNTNSLLKKYKLEQEYLKGIKSQQNPLNNQSVLNESQVVNNNNQEQNENDSDQSEDTRLNSKIHTYRVQYRKNIDEIYKQIKTEYNSPSSRSIYLEEDIINNGYKNSSQVKTEPNEDNRYHNLNFSRPSINFNTTLPKVEEDQNINNLQNQSKTVPINVLLGKIRQRSSYTQKLERLSQNINGFSPTRSQVGSEDMNQSQIANDHIKAQRQNLTSKKYLNMYSRTIDSMHNQDPNDPLSRRQMENYNTNNSLNNTQNGLLIRNAQKSKGGINGLNKSLDVQKLNEEIEMLEQQSKAYQKSLNTSVDFENDQVQMKNNSMTIEEAFKNTLNKHDSQENPRDIAKQLVKVGLIYYSQNQYQVACQKLQKAQSILKKERLQKDILYHWILEHLGNIYKSWKDNEQAFIYYKECYTIRKKLENPNLKQLSQSALNIADLLIQGENYKDAISYLQEILSITAAKVQKNNEWRVKVQLTLAICFGQCKEYKQAYNIIYEQLEQIVSTFDLKNNRDILELILQSVEIIENDHFKKDILSFYQKIKPLIIDCFGQTNEISLRVKERIEELSAYF